MTSTTQPALAGHSLQHVGRPWSAMPAAIGQMADDDDGKQAQIETVVESITVLVDLWRVDWLERFYADEVRADYSSLWGNEPRTIKRNEIGAAWAGFIPGFDTTRHTLDKLRVTLTGNTASARADVTAQHWLDGAQWTIEGAYSFELQQTKDAWVVSAWTFHLASETGDRKLVDSAAARADAHILRFNLAAHAASVRVTRTSIPLQCRQSTAAGGAQNRNRH